MDFLSLLKLTSNLGHTHLKYLLTVSSSDLLDEAVVRNLIPVLRPVVETSEGTRKEAEWLIVACRNSLGDIDTKAPKLRDRIHNPKLSGMVKLLVLFELFLFKFDRAIDGSISIVSFVQNLVPLVPKSAAATLRQWLDDLPQSLRPQQVEHSLGFLLDRPSDEALKRPLVSFIVMIEPCETAECGVSGYVMTRFGKEDAAPNIEPVSLEICSPGEVDCSTQGTFRQVQQAFPMWLEKAMEVIQSRLLAVRKQYNLQAIPGLDVTVEFWLPFDYLSAATEAWNIHGLPVGRQTLSRIVGKEYKVLVRSYDRFHDPEAFLRLNDTWQELASCSQKVNSAAPKMPIFDHLDCWSPSEAESAQVQKSLVGLSLICPLCDRQYSQQREKLFAWMLNNGMPLLLWSRHKDLSEQGREELSKEMQEWLMPAHVTQVEQLFETVYQARKSQNGKLLALWCDDPKPMIDLKEFIDKKGRRLRA